MSTNTTTTNEASKCEGSNIVSESQFAPFATGATKPMIHQANATSFNQEKDEETVLDPVKTIDVKHKNAMAILSIIYANRKNGIAQKDVVKILGLKAPSVFRIFTLLEQAGYIQMVENKGPKVNKIGRRPTGYTIVPTAIYTIGIEFWFSRLSFGVFDFNRQCVYSAQRDLPRDVQAHEIEDLICEITTTAINKLGIEKSSIVGVGIAAPGKVNVATGTVIYYPRIQGMEDYPLKKNVQSRLGLRVYVHNNCSALAYSMYRYGVKDPGSSMFAFLIRGGVNGAMVSKKGIYTTADGTTMEAGHIPVCFDGPKCSCGLTGCLQACLTQLNESARTDPHSTLLFDSVRDPATLDRAAHYIYRGMKTIQRSLSPESFLLICPNDYIAENLAMFIKRIFQTEVDRFQKVKPNIYSIAYDGVMAQAGASDLALDKYFES